MKKATLRKYYEKFSAANSHIVGFVYNHDLYMVEMENIPPRYLCESAASRGQGNSLRLRIKKKYKEQLIRKGAICLGSEDMLDGAYNKGEEFERLVTEYFGQTWTKDSVPFWTRGDINVNGREIQIKLDSATLINESRITSLKAMVA